MLLLPQVVVVVRVRCPEVLELKPLTAAMLAFLISNLMTVPVECHLLVVEEVPVEVEVQMPGERFVARAEVLTDAEKEAVWDSIRDTIPQIRVYEQRTHRNIRVFRLRRVTEAGAA